MSFFVLVMFFSQLALCLAYSGRSLGGNYMKPNLVQKVYEFGLLIKAMPPNQWHHCNHGYNPAQCVTVKPRLVSS